MPTFKNYNEFEKFFNSKLHKAMELTRDEVFEIVSQKVLDYYNEPVFDGIKIPEYHRTGHLMDSLTGGHVKYVNNVYSFTVGWDDEYIFHTLIQVGSVDGDVVWQVKIMPLVKMC